MEKKAFITAAFISVLLLSAIAGIQLVNFGEANPIGPPSNLTIEILSPQNSVYYTNVIVLNFTIARNGWVGDVGSSLDGGGYVAVTNFTEIKREPMPPTEPTGELWQMYNWTRYTYLGTKVFKGLSDKNHSISVCYGHEDPYDKRFFADGDPVTVSFIIDTSPPVIKSLVAENETYTTSSVPLNFTVNKATSWMSYRIDNGVNVTIDGNTTLTGLAEGLHNIVIYANDTAGNMGVSETIKFTIALVIHVLSPERRTYDTSSIPLNFTVNSALAQITYCLNGEKNSTVSGNTTLTGLANGEYALTVYAKDEAGNVGASETILFTVDVPFPTTLVIASIASVAIAVVGLLFYFKKRKKEPGDKT